MNKPVGLRLVVVAILLMVSGWSAAWSALPLKIRDVESMSTPDIVGTPGNPANGIPHIQINTRGLGVFPENQHLASLSFMPFSTAPLPSDCSWTIDLNVSLVGVAQALFCDAGTVPAPIQVRLIALSEEGEIILNIKAGSRVNVTFDGGKKITLFLPALTVQPITEISLFPATDGSTYFDEALTLLAQAAPEAEDEEDKAEEQEEQDVETVIAVLQGEFGQLDVAVNSEEEKVYVPLRQSGGINIFDGQNHTLLQAIPPQPLVVEALAAEVNPVTNRVWVTTCESKLNPRICQRILVFDGENNNLLTTITGQEFHGVKFNPLTNRAYTTNNLGSNITVLDANTNSVLTTVNIGPEPREIAVNPKTNKVYVTAANGLVAVVDGTTNAVTTTLNVGDARGVAVNPKTNKVYVTNGPNNAVTVIDGASDVVVQTIPVAGFPGGIGVNPKTNRIYVSASNTVAVISGSTHTVVATVPVASPGGVEVDPEANRIYVTNFTPGTVTVIQGADEDDD